MPSTQPPRQLSAFACASPFVRKFVRLHLAVVGLALLFSSAAYPQGGVPLVTVATDQTSLNLSNQFGVPVSTAINQAGDFAFVGNGSNALLFRATGASTATRLLQIDDEVPGFPGSKVLSFMPGLGINSSRSLYFGVWFTAGDNAPHAALLLYDGTNYHTVVSSDGIAPGSNGATYGLNLFLGSIDDSGDVNFAAIPSGIGATTFYIVPAGKPPVRIVGLGDTPPTACTWCTAPGGGLEDFFPGTLASVGIFGESLVPPLNSHGQMLLSLWGGLFIGSKDGGFALVPMATTGACSRQFLTTGTAPLPVPGINGFLNDIGAVAFTNPSTSGNAAICVAAAGGGSPSAAITAADPAPASLGGTMASPFALGLDDSGDIVFQSPISGSNLTIFALLRYHPPTGPTNVPTDVVAYNCEQAPGTNGSLFSLLPAPAFCGAPPVGISLLSSPFRGVSLANDGRVSFNASLSGGGGGIYRQTGAATPEFISLEQDGTSTPLLIGTGISFSSFSISPIGQTEILNNGAVFFASYLTTGAADFAEYLGTPGPGNVQSLMSTADQLPSGARTILGTTPPQAAGHFVAFTAQPAAGRTNLLESDVTSGVITRVVSDNDPALAIAGVTPGNTVLGPNFFLNESGQVAFEAVGANTFASEISFSFGSGINSAWSESTSTCGTIYLWSPAGGLKKIAATGDTAPNSTAKFSCVTLNSGAPSPLNSSGEIVFSSTSPLKGFLPCILCGVPTINPAFGADGVFLYGAGGAISEIAAAGDTLPGEGQSTTFVPNLSVAVNSPGQVAFGAQVGTSQGFFLRNTDASQKVISTGDAVPGSSSTFGFPHFISGLSDHGDLAFTAATSSAVEGLFFAPSGGALQTFALDGGAAPGGGTFSFTSSLLPLSGAAGPLSFSPSLLKLVSITANPSIQPLTAAPVFLNNFAAINGESDVAFGASIIGGSANSGYFRVLQSGPAAGTVQPVALQGQGAPGGGTFSTITVPANFVGSRGAAFALGPDGALAFVNGLTSASFLKQGMFVVRPDGSLVKVLATGDVLPGGGLLTGLSMSSKLAAGDAGKFAFLAGIQSGSAQRAIFVTSIPAGVAGTTTTLSPVQDPVLAQQQVGLTATVTSTTPGMPTGTVTFFDNGISLGTGTLNSSGQTTLTTSSLAAGPVSILAQYDGDSKFSPGNSSALVDVVAGFAPPPAPLNVTTGQNLIIPLTLFAPSGSSMNFTLTCSGLPANTTFSFDKNPVTPGPTGTTVQLTLVTMAGSNLPPAQPRKGAPLPGGVGFVMLLAALAAAGTIVWQRTPQWRLLSCACLATFALALMISGCNAMNSTSTSPTTSAGTPKGTTSFTVTGTSGGTTISTTVHMTVQ